MAINSGIVTLDISKNKDLSDEGSVAVLAQSLARNYKLRTLDLIGIRLRKPFLNNFLIKALATNISLIEVIGKIPADSIDPELGVNLMIKQHIEPCFHEKAPPRNYNYFDFDLVDPTNTSTLHLKDKPTKFIMPAFKFMNFHDIRAVNFGNTSFTDMHMHILADYLSK
jgi:hypothetical protein